MREYVTGIIISIGLSPLIVAAAWAGDFDGWCFPANECTGEPMLIDKDTFSTCEGTCEMRNPTKVRSMSGSLYDIVCKTDGAPPSTQRMFFLWYAKPDSATGALAIGNNGPVELVKCQ